MQVSNKQLEALKDCSSAEEIIAKAAAAGFELDAEQAQKLLGLNEFSEVDPEDLEIAGGACTSEYYCEICKAWIEGDPPHSYRAWISENGYYPKFACEGCYQSHKDDPAYDWSR